MKSKISFLAVVLSITSTSYAQTISSSQIDSIVVKAMKTFNVPGISVSIVKDGSIFLEKGYGVRSINNQQPMDNHTLAGIASNSKAFTSAALGILVDEGKLKWDDPLIKYKSTPINLHCIFNSAIDHEIESRFLAKLKFDYNGSNFFGQPSELMRLGRSLPGHSNLNESAALKAGIGQYVIEISTLKDIFKNDPTLRANTIIIVSNKGNDGVSGTIHPVFLKI